MFEQRIILITGKGGVGRSTVAAALATYLSCCGESTLLCDMGAMEDGFSPLARLFGHDRFSEEPQPIAENLQACQLLPAIGHRQFLSHTIPGGALLKGALNSPALQNFMQTAPSFAEMGIFYQLLTLVKAEDKKRQPVYQHIIIDLPATGHTLALTGLPAVLLRIIRHGPVAHCLKEGQSYFNNPNYCRAWVVSLPEQLPVSEALELVDGLRQTSVPVGGVLLNRYPYSELGARQLQRAKEVIGGQSCRGAYCLGRCLDAIDAAARLDKEPDLSYCILPEIQEQGAALVGALADELNEVAQ